MKLKKLKKLIINKSINNLIMNSENIRKYSVIYNNYHNINIFISKILNFSQEYKLNPNVERKKLISKHFGECDFDYLTRIVDFLIVGLKNPKDNNINKISKLFEIFKIFEMYTCLNLQKCKDCYCNILLKTYENDCGNLTIPNSSIEELLHVCLLLKRNNDNDIYFSLHFNNNEHSILSETNKRKLKKNGIFFQNEILYFHDIELININKFKKNLSLKKYCEEKTQNIMINDIKLKDLFIYFE